MNSASQTETSLFPALLIPFAVTLAVVWILNPILIRLSHRYGFLDKPDRRKRHSQPTPNLGGVTIAIGLIAGLCVSFFVSEFEPAMSAVPWLYVVAGALVILAVGVADDIKPLSAWVKLIAQIGAGVILWWGGVTVDPLYIPFIGETHIGAWGVIVSAVWVVALSNAINLIDGLDGLAVGVSIISSLALFFIAMALQVTEASVITLALCGALLATLRYNKYPARLFLGDSGALLIGYMFAALSLLLPIKSFTTTALFPPLVALGAPLLEIVSSFTRRLAAGKSPMRGDRRHLFHYLRYLGLGHRATVRVFWALSLVFGALSVGMLFWDKALSLSALALVMVAVLGLFFILRVRLRWSDTSMTAGTKENGGKIV